MEKIIITGPEQICENFADFLSGEKKGIIELPIGVANINDWCRAGSNKYSIALGIPEEQLEKILYFANRVVKDPKDTGFAVGDVVTHAQAKGAEFLYGMAALEFLLDRVDLNTKFKALRDKEIECMQKLQAYRNEFPDEFETDTDVFDEDEDLEEDQKARRAEFEQTLEILWKTRDAIEAIWYVKRYGLRNLKIDKISLFPLELRPIVNAMSEIQPYSVLDELSMSYYYVAMRSSRLKRLMELGAPEIIILNESRVLQEYVDRLICNGKRGLPCGRNSRYKDDEETVLNDQFFASPSLTDLVLRYINLV